MYVDTQIKDTIALHPYVISENAIPAAWAYAVIYSLNLRVSKRFWNPAARICFH